MDNKILYTIFTAFIRKRHGSGGERFIGGLESSMANSHSRFSSVHV